MFSVYILQDFLKQKDDEKEIGVFQKEKTDIYCAVLYALLNYNKIKCKIIKPLGLERDFKVKSKSSESIIYAPVFELSNCADISFIYTDCTENFSQSFKLASILRQARSGNDDKVIFINPLKSTDFLANFSPAVFDVLRISDAKAYENSVDPFIMAFVTAKAFCEFFGIDFKSNNFMHI